MYPVNGGFTERQCWICYHRKISKFRQQPAEAFHAVVDVIGAKRVPICRRVDRDDRFAQPHFSCSSEAGTIERLVPT